MISLRIFFAKEVERLHQEKYTIEKGKVAHWLKNEPWESRDTKGKKKKRGKIVKLFTVEKALIAFWLIGSI